MKTEFSAYKELVLDEDENGGTWIGRIYKRKGPATMLATASGSAKDLEAARDAAVEWADAELEKYRIAPAPVSSLDAKRAKSGRDIVGIIRKTF